MMGFIAYFITDWRYYQIAITFPGIIFLAYWYVKFLKRYESNFFVMTSLRWFIPESVRWLLTKNKMHKAVLQIKKIAQSNNVELTKEILDKFVESEMSSKKTSEERDGGRKPSALDLFRQPHLRTKAILIFFNWFVISGACE